MAGNELSYKEFFSGLTVLAQSSFPKKCGNCGRVYESEEQFLLETRDINASSSGLKPSEDDEGEEIIELFRNCLCGSTLMEYFSNRRDCSEQGRKRREKFDGLLQYLIAQGIDKTTARRELINVLRGEKSDVLAKIRPPDLS